MRYQSLLHFYEGLFVESSHFYEGLLLNLHTFMRDFLLEYHIFMRDFPVNHCFIRAITPFFESQTGRVLPAGKVRI